MKNYINSFDTFDDIETALGNEELNAPYVAYAEGEDKVYMGKEYTDYLTCWFDVTSTTNPTKIAHSNVTKISVDDGEFFDWTDTGYTFETTGIHKVKYQNTNAFYSCQELIKARIPAGLNPNFEQCINLKTVIFEYGNNEILTGPYSWKTSKLDTIYCYTLPYYYPARSDISSLPTGGTIHIPEGFKRIYEPFVESYIPTWKIIDDLPYNGIGSAGQILVNTAGYVRVCGEGTSSTIHFAKINGEWTELLGGQYVFANSGVFDVEYDNKDISTYGLSNVPLINYKVVDSRVRIKLNGINTLEYLIIDDGTVRNLVEYEVRGNYPIYVPDNLLEDYLNSHILISLKNRFKPLSEFPA